MIRPYLLIILSFFLAMPAALAQIKLGDQGEVDYASPKTYTIGGITVQGVEYLDHNVLILLTGLSVGDVVEIPGEKITGAIDKLWQQGLFEDIRISLLRTDGELAFLEVSLKERPRLSRFSFKGVRKAEADNLRDEIKIARGDVVTAYTIMSAQEKIRNYFIDKGFLKAEAEVRQERDTALSNSVVLEFRIRKHQRVRIDNIVFEGNKEVSEARLKSALKETKDKAVIRPFALLDSLLWRGPGKVLNYGRDGASEWLAEQSGNNLRIRIFKSSKYIESNFLQDKVGLVERYNELGYRDALVTGDSISWNPDGTVDLHIFLEEGRKYYFRNITWVGNTKYPASTLDAMLGIKKGDIYNQKKLDANLSYNPSGYDVSSLYLDDGYLFFQLVPVETQVLNDSIDIEIRLREGKQATINKVSIKGNTKTNDHVVMREIRTRPGQLFSRADIIRTTRELAQLKYFNAEKINPVPIPNAADGTVDIEYEVEETSADQIELSGGWGYGRVVGTLGLSFNNFSVRNMFKRNAWQPVPS
ncbi:MAG TPA: POTRA domain-containing protein, partial [Bacteroidales bacterium]|nr:POTRA domain-containing protein [Bacteroidales bacterium]